MPTIEPPRDKSKCPYCGGTGEVTEHTARGKIKRKCPRCSASTSKPRLKKPPEHPLVKEQRAYLEAMWEKDL